MTAAGSRPTWKPHDDMPRRQVKLAYLMMLCAESALPMGGDVTPVDGTRRAMVACRPRRSHRDGGGPLVRPALRPRRVGRPLQPADVQFLALHELAEAMARTLNYVHDETSLRLTTA
jgi:histidine phosphotransferase ChpT